MTIELKEVNFSHAEAPDKTVLRIDHWSLTAGEQVFVHGPSGSGKTTLAVHLALRGLGYLGDDVQLLELESAMIQGP